MTANLRHAQSGVLKPAPLGFSWTTLFFSGFPALFRGDLKWAVIMWIVHCSMIVVSFFTFGLASLAAHIAFAAIYNKRYIVELMAQGFEPADDHSRNEMARMGVVAMQGPVVTPSSYTPHWEEPEPVPEPEPVRKANLERQTLAAARARNGVLTPTDVSIDAECSLDKAKQMLEDMVSRGHAEMRSTRSGDLVYAFPSLLDEKQRNQLEPLV